MRSITTAVRPGLSLPRLARTVPFRSPLLGHRAMRVCPPEEAIGELVEIAFAEDARLLDLDDERCGHPPASVGR